MLQFNKGINFNENDFIKQLSLYSVFNLFNLYKLVK